MSATEATNPRTVRELTRIFENRHDADLAKLAIRRQIGLDRPHRLTYILGEILELGGEEAAAILEIQPAAFRKRLSRAREQIEAFLASRCGLVDPDNACRCVKVLPTALAAGIVDANRLRYRSLPTREADRLLIGIERARTAAELFRSLPTYGSPEDFTVFVRTLVDA
jgi:hypothetical protein